MEIFNVTKNTDTVEGRGPMVLNATFFNFKDAEKYVLAQSGISGSEQKLNSTIGDHKWIYNGYSIERTDSNKDKPVYIATAYGMQVNSIDDDGFHTEEADFDGAPTADALILTLTDWEERAAKHCWALAPLSFYRVMIDYTPRISLYENQD